MGGHANGSFCWVDLAAHDYDGAVGFYGTIFGWTHEPAPPGGPRYGMFKDGDAVVAGIGEMAPEMKAVMPSVWNSYVQTADARATVAKAKELGGEVVFDAYETPGGTGTLAFLKDPTGAVFALWQPAAHTSPAKLGEPFACCWQELATRDPEAAQAFYGALFGWTFTPGSSPEVVYFISNGDQMIGHFIRMNEQWGDLPPAWTPYFAVKDTDATCEAVKAAGGTVPVEGTDIPAGRFAVIGDVQKAHSYVIQLAHPPG
ncbi:MAG: VOC family protein [Myxococcota bacterium]